MSVCTHCKAELEPLSGRLKNGKIDKGLVLVCPVCDAPDKKVSNGKSPLMLSKENYGNTSTGS